MTTLRPEEKSKAILLTAAVTLVFGLGGANIARQIGIFRPHTVMATAPASPAAPETRVAASSARKAVDTVPAVPVTASDSEGIPPPAPAVVAAPDFAIDPFRPVSPEDGTRTAAIPSAPAAPTAVRRPAPATVTVTTAPPPAPAPPVTLRPAVPPSMPAPVPVPTPSPEPALALIGTVDGLGTGPSVALLRVAGRTRFLRVGTIVASYRVARISAETVTLRRGDRVRVLTIGVPEDEQDKGSTRPPAGAVGP